MMIIKVNMADALQWAREDYGKHKNTGDQIIAKVTAENRDFTPDEHDALRESQERCRKIRDHIELIEGQIEEDEQEQRMGGRRPDRRDPSTDPEGDEPIERSVQASKEYRDAFRQYLRFGLGEMEPEQRKILREGKVDDESRAQTTGTGSSGGFLIPQGFVPTIEKAMKAFAWIGNAPVGVINTASGNPLPFPTANATTQTGRLVSENAAVNTVDLAFGETSLGAYLFTTDQVLVPISLLEDTGVNLEQYIGEALGERAGRTINAFTTTGTGSSQPQGIVTGSTEGVEAAGVAAITYDELINLKHSVDPAYRANARWMWHDTTFALLRKLKDADGRPLWQPSLIAGVAPTFDGDPYVINQNMAVPAANAKSVVYGDFSKYRVRNVGSMRMRRLDEIHAQNDQVAFLGFWRMDAKVIDGGGGAIKHLVQAAS